MANATTQRLVAQVDWIAEHGGSCAGYVARYGSKSDPDHYGNGGEAIYAADLAELERLKAECWRRQNRGPSRA